MKIRRMRRTYLLMVGLLLSYSLMSAPINTLENDNCPTNYTDFNPDLTFVENLSQVLVKGVWVETLPAKNGKTQVQSLLQFNQSREVDLLIRESGTAFNHYNLTWKIEEVGEKTLLVLSGGLEDFEKIYWLDANCQGIELTDYQQGQQIIMEYRKELPQDHIVAICQALTGRWENNNFPLELAQVDPKGQDLEDEMGTMYYDFKRDGSYQKYWRNTKHHLKESGSWEVSSDGKHLILHAKGRNDVASHIVRIKYIELDEMVLEHEFPNSVNAELVKLKDFYFNKL